MLTHDVLGARGGVLWLGAYERGEPVPLVSLSETLTLGVPGNFFADLLTTTHLTADFLTLSPYEITSGRLMPHGRVAVTVRITGEPIEFVEFTDAQVLAHSETAIDLLVPNLRGNDRLLALVGDEFVTLQCVSRELVETPPWSWTPPDCQWWSARFAVHSAAEYLGSG